MKAKLFAFAATILWAGLAHAATCPDFSGYYWNSPDDRPTTEHGGMLTEIDQLGCDQLVFLNDWVNSDNQIVFRRKHGPTWHINGKPCTPDEGGSECEVHRADDKAIYSAMPGVMKLPGHGTCRYFEVIWSLDPKGIQEKIPFACPDYYRDTATRILERVAYPF